ncbi:ABC transporter permease [Demequina capsici]|uniref:Transport permease protein n=1 Tax=Demequina capsici TaxID=3075620 RepID=A0AA96FE56_9MICO|nr:MULTISPECIES: ABC transporter permease [unclassified Demequina]WNM24108.1 ABC transporter permease [Demequina sp. OYTSA14]WNM26936.1 ABC transporter permease [Demequina sp. PMTSA13]
MTATSTARTSPAWASMTLNRYVVELKEFTRNREQMIFIFMFPIMFLLLFGSVFGGQEISDDGVTFAQYFLPGMIASGIIYTGFQSLAMSIALDRDEDLLKRIHATPLPASAYFAGKILQVITVSLVQIAALILLGVAIFDTQLPTDPGKWLTFAWVFLLGTGASTTLGIATSSLLRSSRAASAILTPVVLLLQFTSGVYLVYTQIPTFLQHFAEIFPLKWLAQGLRSVFLPDNYMYAEARQSWELPMAATVLAAWLVVGLLVSMRTFRWTRPDDR